MATEKKEIGKNRVKKWKKMNMRKSMKNHVRIESEHGIPRGGLGVLGPIFDVKTHFGRAN